MSDQLPGLLTPTKNGLGRFLGQFYSEFTPQTKAGMEWKSRGLARAMAFTPGRMIDHADDMLESWRKNANTTGGSGPAQPGGTAFLPVVLIAVGKDWTPVTGDVGRQVAERLPVTLPDDVQERVFGLRVMQAEVRTQLAVFAAEPETAGSIISQLCLFLSHPARRSFHAIYRFAGHDLPWAVQVQTPDLSVIDTPGEQQNLTILTVDLMLRPSIPLFDAPAAGQPNDGQGTPGEWGDPAGYPVVGGITTAGGGA